jgi:hypothetical protein
MRALSHCRLASASLGGGDGAGIWAAASIASAVDGMAAATANANKTEAENRGRMGWKRSPSERKRQI